MPWNDKNKLRAKVQIVCLVTRFFFLRFESGGGRGMERGGREQEIERQVGLRERGVSDANSFSK